jgi:Zn-dependent alcohol dehydrogenase
VGRFDTVVADVSRKSKGKSALGRNVQDGAGFNGLDGRLFLDEMISSRIPLSEVNDALDQMRKGQAARQVIVFD